MACAVPVPCGGRAECHVYGGREPRALRCCGQTIPQQAAMKAGSSNGPYGRAWPRCAGCSASLQGADWKHRRHRLDTPERMGVRARRLNNTNPPDPLPTAILTEMTSLVGRFGCVFWSTCHRQGSCVASFHAWPSGRRRKARAAAATPGGEGGGRPPAIEHASDWIDVGREVRRRSSSFPRPGRGSSA